MKRSLEHQNAWPDSSQRLLLRATLLDDERALSAWDEWSSIHTIDSVEAKSSRLLPGLYENLKTLRPADPALDRLGGMLRYTWYKNQMLLKEARLILERLEDAGMQPVLIKGMALALQVYPNPGLRPMNDIDILVQPDEAREAFGLIGDLGWELRLPVKMGAHVRYNHSLSWQSEKDFIFDLHWHAITHRHRYAAHGSFMEDVKRIEREEFIYRVPHPADQLLITIDHGLKWEQVYAPIHWLMDLSTLLEHHGDQIDWRQVIENAKTFKIAYTITQALKFLHELLDQPVPDDLRRELGRLRFGWVERTEFKLKSLPPGRLGMAPLFVLRYFAYLNEANIWQRLRAFPGFLAYVMNTQTPTQFIREAFLRLARNLGFIAAKRSDVNYKD